MAERCDGLFPRYGRAILKKIIEPTAGFRMLNQNADRNPRAGKYLPASENLRIPVHRRFGDNSFYRLETISPRQMPRRIFSSPIDRGRPPRC
ncbi:MAG: hypothetical protein OXI74_18670, partial [Rhodospirillaceae bacterium]|nr:hypothetical protein [Rhodospirillaceae bacterium]